MNSRRYYAVLLRMKGDRFPAMSKKIGFVTRLLAAVFLGVALAGYFFVDNMWGAVILALGCAVTGACLAIDRSMRRRVRAWPLLNEVINWPLVEEKSKKKG